MNIKDRVTVEYEMEQSMSEESKKNFPEYYELKLQIRFVYFDELYEIKKIVFDRITKNIRLINKLEELDNGFDIYIGVHSEMSKIPALFNKDFLIEEKRSKKLIGRDNLRSKNKYRYTQNITLINLKKGDIIAYKGVNKQIKAINKSGLILIDQETKEKNVLTYSIVKDYLEPVTIQSFQKK